jgi:malonate-semialdehyde dehydrogenase (acetylating) / methylmalonate-semialdehyde dehydrogenase
VECLIQCSIDDGAVLLLDGRKPSVPGLPLGNFVGASILSLDLRQKLNTGSNKIPTENHGFEGDYGKLSADSPLRVTNRGYLEEIFGPVLFCVHVNTLDEAIAFTNNSKYGNGCAIFTQR